MLVSFVFDSNIFSAEAIEDSQIRQNLNAFLAGVLCNGILLDTPSAEAFTTATAQIQELCSRPEAQKALIWWTEIAKNKGKYLVQCQRRTGRNWSTKMPHHDSYAWRPRWLLTQSSVRSRRQAR